MHMPGVPQEPYDNCSCLCFTHEENKALKDLAISKAGELESDNAGIQTQLQLIRQNSC